MLNAEPDLTVLLDMHMNVKLAGFGLAIKLLPGKLYSRDFVGVRKIGSSFAAASFEHFTDAGHAASPHCLFRPSSIRRRQAQLQVSQSQALRLDPRSSQEVRNNRPYGLAADIFSFGITIHELFCEQ